VNIFFRLFSLSPPLFTSRYNLWEMEKTKQHSHPSRKEKRKRQKHKRRARLRRQMALLTSAGSLSSSFSHIPLIGIGPVPLLQVKEQCDTMPNSVHDEVELPEDHDELEEDGEEHKRQRIEWIEAEKKFEQLARGKQPQKKEQTKVSSQPNHRDLIAFLHSIIP
jgi:hypothetical protein